MIIKNKKQLNTINNSTKNNKKILLMNNINNVINKLRELHEILITIENMLNKSNIQINIGIKDYFKGIVIQFDNYIYLVYDWIKYLNSVIWSPEKKDDDLITNLEKYFNDQVAEVNQNYINIYWTLLNSEIQEFKINNFKNKKDEINELYREVYDQFVILYEKYLELFKNNEVLLKSLNKYKEELK